MHDETSARDDAAWIATAAEIEIEAPSERPREPSSPEARRALAWAIVGVVCLGFVFGPLALAIGHRAMLASVGEARHADARLARTAMTIGRIGMALHITLVATVLPWLLFALPLVGI